MALTDYWRQYLPKPKGMAQQEIELARSTDEEKQSQINRLKDFHQRNAGQSSAMLEKLKQTVIDDGNVFAVLVDAITLLFVGADQQCII